MSNLLGLQQRNPFVLLLCFIYKLTDQSFNNEKMFKINCVLKCFDLCTLIWIIMTFFYFQFYQRGQLKKQPKVKDLKKYTGNVSRIKWFCCLWRFLEVAGLYLQMGRQSWMLRWPTSQIREDGRLGCSLATYDSYRLPAYACRRGLWDVMLKFSGDYLVSFLGSSPHGKMMQPN